jgi:hypothetical protein
MVRQQVIGILSNIKSLDKFSLTNEIGNKENEKRKRKKALDKS